MTKKKIGHCLECALEKNLFSKGLCPGCYILCGKNYPATPQWLKKKQIVEDYPEPTRKASAPTTHQPGSKGKIKVLSQRLANGEELWHPQDNRISRNKVADPPTIRPQAEAWKTIFRTPRKH